MQQQGLWRRTPPAIFPPIMGLMGLGLAWRHGAASLGLPVAVAELILGATTALFAFAFMAWLAKALRRLSVVPEELRVLPGRAGVTAMSLSMMLIAAALVPYDRGIAISVAIIAFTTHSLLALLILHSFATGPAEGRAVTPVWHLTFVGFILGPLAGIPLGFTGIAEVILLTTMPVGLAIWAVSLWQLWHRSPPAPLRPLLAIHLAPASLFATVGHMLGMHQLAFGFAVLGGLILVALLIAGRWITAAGFSPLWGAFTFPLAAYTSAVLRVSGGAGEGGMLGGLLLLAATIAIPVIAFRVMRAWARGTLAARTNAAAV